jgi:methylamine---corrinoid protein Co-methyltransferase
LSVTVQEIWHRAEKGATCPVKTFDLKIVFPKVQELVRRYEITYDPNSIVPTDDELIDRVYEAGLELLVDVGVLCVDTEKLITFTREEVEGTISLAATRVTVGEGKEAVTIRHRAIEDPSLPFIMAGPHFVPISEDLQLRVYEAYGREPAVDSLVLGTETKVAGLEVKPGSVSEMRAAKQNVAAVREGFRRAGRPGTCIVGSEATSAAAIIACCDPRYYRTSDVLDVSIGVQLKVDQKTLSVVDHARDYGCHLTVDGTAFIGGFFGGPEGAAVGAVAETLASYLVLRGEMTSLWAPEISFGPGMSGRRSLWANALAHAACARHMPYPVLGWTPQHCYAGPCTDMYLQEIAASTVASVVCGSSATHGAGRRGVEQDCFGGPLDARYLREVADAATKLDRTEANRVVKALLARYEDRISEKDAPAGKRFQECNDLDTLQPTREYVAMYEGVKEELEALGLDLRGTDGRANAQHAGDTAE